MQWPFPRDWVLKFSYLVPEEGTRSLLPGAKNMWMRVAGGIWLAQVLPLQIVNIGAQVFYVLQLQLLNSAFYGTT